jgi:hypothetical protein
MVAWWKRLLLSLLCMIVATVFCFLAIVAYSAAKSQPVSFRSSEVLLTTAVTVGFCTVAWVFSVPVVLIITNIGGWRFWFYWVLGTCVGPALMLGLTSAIFFMLPHAPGQPLLNPAVYPLIYLAGAISCLTSIFYLSLLRKAQAKAAFIPA